MGLEVTLTPVCYDNGDLHFATVGQPYTHCGIPLRPTVSVGGECKDPSMHSHMCHMCAVTELSQVLAIGEGKIHEVSR